MRFPHRLFPRAWMVAPICAFAFIAWADVARVKRVELVSSVAGEDARTDVSSPTGYAGGKRWLIVPEHNNPTFQWIEETQLMVAHGVWRVRRVDYENSPFGRDVHSASPYRWWLTCVAWCDHVVSGRPLGLSLEKAALFADPLLHLLLLVMGSVFVSRRFGTFSAILFSIGVAGLYPLAGAFVPGVANDFGLAQICTFWSILLLVAGVLAKRRHSSLFFSAGVAGGCGLWLNATGQMPVVVGIVLGGLLAAWVARSAPKTTADSAIPRWRAWAMGGAVSSFIGYLIEYFPSHMGPELRVNYPIYALAWLGLGELMWRIATWKRNEKPFGSTKAITMWILSAAAAASLPIAFIENESHAFLARDLLSTRLTNLSEGIVADNFSAWLARDGLTGALAATCLPLLLLAPAAWLLVRSRAGIAQRSAVAIALGPILGLLALAVYQIRWWNTLDSALLALLVAAASAASATRALKWSLAGLTGFAVAFGLFQLLPPAYAGSPNDFKFTRAEIEGLYERALAQWIADHAGPDGATVLVPPFRTSSFCFYGGLRGLGTQNWENRDGLSATFRIVNATRPDETQALVTQYGITHIVLPSWDTDLDNFARMGLKRPTDSFVYALHKTDGGIFNWLRALPYNLPAISGFEDQSVLVLAVGEEADAATVRSRLVEYLMEMHQVEAAANSSQALLRYPANLGALVALAQVQKARGEEDGFQKAFGSVVSNLSSGSDRSLPWDRRVSLAVVLALGNRNDLARIQVERCLREIDAEHIRSLTTGSLYHLLVLTKGYDLEIRDPALRELALSLLPGELRERL
jgi:hypothetical protein